MDSLFEGQWQILQGVAQGVPQSELLEAIVRLIEAQAEGMLCSILLFDARRQTLHHGAAPSLPIEYVRAIDGLRIGPHAGSCGAAAFTQQPMIAEDTETHPNWAPWRELTKRHRLRACWSTPILSPDRALLGTFAMYYHAPRRPAEIEKRWISTATHLTSITITLARQAELEDQLRRSQRLEAVGRLAGGIAHDFNNLLSVILGYSTMLADSLPPADPARSDVEEVRRAAGRASELTRQLLAFGRRQVMAPEQLDLNEALRTLHDQLQLTLGEKIVLCLEPRADTATVRLDPRLLQQLVSLLAANAREAMPRGGQLVLRTEDAWLDEAYTARHPGTSPGRYVAFVVEDTGEGMDAATLERIFEPFFTTKEQGRGAGLGLATVWGIVSQSGGGITASSTLGVGTRFEIHFPVADETPLASPHVPSPEPLEGQFTILVVEDEAQVRKLLCSVLRRAGYHVLEAIDGREGLAESQRHHGPIDLLLTDILMPHVQGPELARAMRQQRPETKVLYLSGYTDSAMDHHGVVDAPITLLSKPIAPRELLREVRDLLERG